MTTEDEQRSRALNRKIALWLSAVITVAWGASFIIDVIDNHYDPPASVHVLMMTVAGSVFGEGLFQAVKKNGAQDGSSSSSKDGG